MARRLSGGTAADVAENNAWQLADTTTAGHLPHALMVERRHREVGDELVDWLSDPGGRWSRSVARALVEAVVAIATQSRSLPM